MPDTAKVFGTTVATLIDHPQQQLQWDATGLLLLNHLAAHLQLSDQCLPTCSDLERIFSTLEWLHLDLSDEGIAALTERIFWVLKDQFTIKWPGFIKHDTHGRPLWPAFTEAWCAPTWNGDTTPPARGHREARPQRPRASSDLVSCHPANKLEILQQFIRAWRHGPGTESYQRQRDDRLNSAPVQGLGRQMSTFVANSRGRRHRLASLPPQAQLSSEPARPANLNHTRRITPSEKSRTPPPSQHSHRKLGRPAISGEIRGKRLQPENQTDERQQWHGPQTPEYWGMPSLQKSRAVTPVAGEASVATENDFAPILEFIRQWEMDISEQQDMASALIDGDQLRDARYQEST